MFYIIISVAIVLYALRELKIQGSTFKTSCGYLLTKPEVRKCLDLILNKLTNTSQWFVELCAFIQHEHWHSVFAESSQTLFKYNSSCKTPGSRYQEALLLGLCH